MTIARAATTLLWHTSRTRSFTKSQDLSLLSIARLNKASSRTRFAIWRRTRIAQISFSFGRRLPPDQLPFIPGDMRRCRRGMNERLHDGSPRSVNDELSLNPKPLGGVRAGDDCSSWAAMNLRPRDDFGIVIIPLIYHSFVFESYGIRVRPQ